MGIFGRKKESREPIIDTGILQGVRDAERHRREERARTSPEARTEEDIIEAEQPAKDDKDKSDHFLVEPNEEERANILKEKEEQLTRLRGQLQNVDSNLKFKRAELSGATGTFTDPIEKEIAELTQQRDALSDEIARWEK